MFRKLIGITALAGSALLLATTVTPAQGAPAPRPAATFAVPSAAVGEQTPVMLSPKQLSGREVAISMKRPLVIVVTDKSGKWRATISDSSVAEFTRGGTRDGASYRPSITAKKVGKTKVTLKSPGGHKYTFTLKVSSGDTVAVGVEPAPLCGTTQLPSPIISTPKQLVGHEVAVSSKTPLVLVLSGKDSKWRASVADPSIAKFVHGGTRAGASYRAMIKAKSEGTTKVTLKSPSGKKYAFTVTVVTDPQASGIRPFKCSGSQVPAPIMLTPAQVAGHEVDITVSTPLVLTVDQVTGWTATIADPTVAGFEAGRISDGASYAPSILGKKEGTTQVTLTAPNGTTTTFTVKVVAAGQTIGLKG